MRRKNHIPRKPRSYIPDLKRSRYCPTITIYDLVVGPCRAREKPYTSGTEVLHSNFKSGRTQISFNKKPSNARLFEILIFVTRAWLTVAAISTLFIKATWTTVTTITSVITLATAITTSRTLALENFIICIFKHC